ncbi:MAG: methyltransferase domain-containing protein [Eubacterium sp.]|nr:methyltransferase domain-containing protein [Eubacterium sp.]
MTELEQYYNKFCEEKRLGRRHGQVEYIISMKYIHKYLEGIKNPSIIDIGAGTGRYSVQLANEGYDVTAVELVKYNLGILKSKGSSVKAYHGNARKLSRFADASFDMALLFGPMYHLYTMEDKVQALREAARVTKPGGYILAAYCMNEYGVLMYGFRQGNVRQCLEDGRLTKEFHCVSKPKDLYDYVRLEDIERINKEAGLTRVQIIAPDGPANYMRQALNAMDEETFALFVEYQMSVCERQDLLGASAHTVDILQVS